MLTQETQARLTTFIAIRRVNGRQGWMMAPVTSDNKKAVKTSPGGSPPFRGPPLSGARTRLNGSFIAFHSNGADIRPATG